MRGKATGITNRTANIGLHKNYFHVMRTKQEQKYDYLKALDDDIIEAYHKYENEMLNILSDMLDIYYMLEDDKLIYRFSVFLYNKKLFSNKHSFASGAKHVLFKATPRLNHSTFIRYKEIINVYNNEFSKKTKTRVST